MSHRTLLSSIVAVVVASHVASAQTITTTTPLISPSAVPIATTSFTPYVGTGSLGTAYLGLALGDVTFAPWQKGPVELNGYSGSAMLRLQNLSSGSYSVQYDFTFVGSPTSLTIASGSAATSPIASCSLVLNFTSTTQTCNSGVFAAGGDFYVWLLIHGGQAQLNKITINRWK